MQFINDNLLPSIIMIKIYFIVLCQAQSLSMACAALLVCFFESAHLRKDASVRFVVAALVSYLKQNKIHACLSNVTCCLSLYHNKYMQSLNVQHSNPVIKAKTIKNISNALLDNDVPCNLHPRRS